MADELPEKVRAFIVSNKGANFSAEELDGFARLAIEESTRDLREKLENAEEGYARRHKDATDLWEKINFPGGLNAQILELRERLERAQAALRIIGEHPMQPGWYEPVARAIREAKEAKHV